MNRAAGLVPSAKRPRSHEADSLVRRKRAATACRFCRLRKTRCDNVRPVCGVCKYHEATCIYSEEDLANQPTEPSVPLGQDIISRLDEIKSILQAEVVTKLCLAPLPSVVRNDDFQHLPALVQSATNEDSGSPAGSWSTSHPSQSVCLNTRCETVLQWPILQPLLPEAVTSIQYFVFDEPTTDPDTPTSPVPNSDAQRVPFITSDLQLLSAVGVREENLLSLCHKFLRYVHARNPILDPAQLLRYAAYAAENGLGWDAPSCLVLIACGLACYTEPWPIQVATSPVITTRRDSSASSIANQQGIAHYTAAKKRMGLLGTSIIDIQCYFLASMLEKCLMQPLQAWFHLQQACQRMQSLLRKRGRHPNRSHETVSNTQHSAQHLEQRIFWSCYKSEQELITELGLQSSGINYLDYPHLLPDPPTPVAIWPGPPSTTASPDFSFMDTIFHPPGPSSSAGPDAGNQEQSWSFYLTEISLRRTMVQTLRALYEGSAADWSTDPEKVVHHIDDTIKEIHKWYAHLPQSVRFSQENNGPDHVNEDELTTLTRARFTEWREACLRPAMYLILCRRSFTAANRIIYRRLHHHAQNCLDLCIGIIRSFSRSRHQRHGGTWFTTRSMFRTAMQTVAAVQFNRASRTAPSPLPESDEQSTTSTSPEESNLDIPEDWSELCTTALGMLKQWGREAADVKAMASVLEYAVAAAKAQRF